MVYKTLRLKLDYLSPYPESATFARKVRNGPIKAKHLSTDRVSKVIVT